MEFKWQHSFSPTGDTWEILLKEQCSIDVSVDRSLNMMNRNVGKIVKKETVLSCQEMQIFQSFLLCFKHLERQPERGFRHSKNLTKKRDD